MKYLTVVVLYFIFNLSYGNSDSLVNSHLLPNKSIGSLKENNLKLQKSKFKYKGYPSYYDYENHKPILKNELAPFGQKVLLGMGEVFTAQTLTTGLLLVLPESFSNWKIKEYKQNYKEAFTKPPVFDKDVWYINYIGHPYQGSYYYNAYRSQGAKWWQASLFSFAHSTFWEYLIESGFERPSIQDLIVTPGLGSLFGELMHFSTIKMSRNGFKWYEAAFVSLFNPMFAINNGFKRFNKEQNKPLIIQ